MRTTTLPAAVLAGLVMLGCGDSDILQPVADDVTPDGQRALLSNLWPHTPGESVPFHIRAASTETWADVLVVDDFLGPGDADDAPDLVRVGAGMAFWLLQQETVVPDDFGGRCSRPSLWVFHFEAEGVATHAGRLESLGGHCTYPPAGPGALPTYGDGEVVSVTASGDELWLDYDAGTSGFTPDPTVGTFQDQVTIVGGTGRFTGASGEARETGVFDFSTGQFEIEIDGHIAYAWAPRRPGSVGPGP